MKKTGFTLVELLVTIAIIAILAGVGVAVFSMAQKNTRDQMRIRDLQTIKQALEMYRSDEGGYPDDTDINFIPDGLISLISPSYLSAWPTDPVSGQSYVYVKTAGGFVVCAKKEGSMADFSPCVSVSVDCTDTDKCNIGLQSD